MIINISIDTKKHEAVIRMGNAEEGKVVTAADLYDLVVHDLPKEIARIVKDSRNGTAE